MIVHSGMTDVGCHFVQHLSLRQINKLVVVNYVELQNSRPKLKSMGPFSPATGSLFSIYGKHWSPLGLVVFSGYSVDFFSRKRPELVYFFF